MQLPFFCSTCRCWCIDWLDITDEYLPHLAIPMCILLAGGCACVIETIVHILFIAVCSSEQFSDPCVAARLGLALDHQAFHF